MLYSSIEQLHEAQVFSVSMTSPSSVVDCDIYITAYAYSTVKKCTTEVLSWKQNFKYHPLSNQYKLPKKFPILKSKLKNLHNR